jgi:hypothetical protein
MSKELRDGVVEDGGWTVGNLNVCLLVGKPFCKRKCGTVDIFIMHNVIMHNVIMHNSHNAWLADQNHHGTQGDRAHNAY